MATIEDVLAEKGTDVYHIDPEATVFEAISQMVDANCGSLLVMKGDDIVGVITERDYLRKVALEGRTSKTTAVEEIMSGPVIVVESTAEIDEALAMMADRKIRHLPVLSEGRLAGLVSVSDLVQHKTKEQSFQIKYLEDYISAR